MEFLNHWWNVPYVALLGLVAVGVLIQLAGGVDSHDLDHDLDHDIDHGLHTGDLPATVRFSVFALVCGSAGLLWNRFAFTFSPAPALLALVGFVHSLLLGRSAVKIVSALSTRFFGELRPSTTSHATLVGEIGTVASPVADARHGELSVRTPDDDDVLVHVRVLGAPLRYGSSALIVSYEASTGTFVCEALAEEKEK